MKIKDIIGGSLGSQKEFVDNLKLQKKISDYAKNNSVVELYSKVHNDYSPVFVLSTGRSGTAFLTNMLEADKSLKVFHEPDPVFSYHTKFAFENYKKNPDVVKAMFDTARYELIRNTFIEKKRYVETNNRISFFAFQLAELFPKAKFIHLVRNPSSFIKSGLARDWYSNHSIFDEGRISKGGNDWNSKSPIEKIGWLWNETNSFIEEFKKQQEGVHFVKAEDLFSSAEEQIKIFEFLELKKPSNSELQKRTSKKVNKGKDISIDNKIKNEISEMSKQLPLCKLYGY